MPIIKNLIYYAARRAMNDEKLRQKATETFEKEIKPRAEAAWSEAKPRIENARDDIRKIAKKGKPMENPGNFAGQITRRIFDEFTKDKKKE